MAANLEIKVKLPDISIIENKLNSVQFSYEGILRQKDIYFNTGLSGRLKLRIMPERSEVIYYNRNESEGERWSDYTLLKVDGGEAELFFSRMFQTLCIVEKTRKLYMYLDTRIHLDTVTNLGTFMELEAVEKGNPAEAREQFEYLYDYLKLGTFTEIKNSYSDLLITG